MIVLLRFIGVMNAAVWFGAGLFFTFGVAPAFFGAAMRTLLGGDTRAEAFLGLMAQMMMERYFVLNYWCGAVALVHVLAEWVYLGKRIQRVTLGIVVGAFCLMLVGGTWIQPKLSRLHKIKHHTELYAQAGPYSSVEKLQAARSFSFWHGLSQIMNLAVLGGLGVYLWRVTHAADAPRFVSSNKFRS